MRLHGGVGGGGRGGVGEGKPTNKQNPHLSAVTSVDSVQTLAQTQAFFGAHNIQIRQGSASLVCCSRFSQVEIYSHHPAT